MSDQPTELVVADIGGTNARFAIASVAAAGTIDIGEPIVLGTSDYVSLQTAWDEYERRAGRVLPRAAAFSIAAPITGQVLRMTNNSWVIDTAALDRQLGLDRATVLNDFGAVAHAAARAPEDAFEHICGPARPLPAEGTVSVVGPGTGLGVAYFRRDRGGAIHVQATEGGHIEFGPVDTVDDAILARLRAHYGHVSTERVVAGPGIVDIHAALAGIEHRDLQAVADAETWQRTIWQRGIAGEDALCAAAVERACMILGSVAGGYALAHGATGLVLAGGIAARLRDMLPRSGFPGRFIYKGRYEQIMADIPVKLITLPQPGLYGAAAAFAAEHLT